MSVWYAIPSKKPAADAQLCIDAWRWRGYRVAIWRDVGDAPVECDLMLTGEYAGYPKAVNALCRAILDAEPLTDWIVSGGDDIWPDAGQEPEKIAEECGEHFWEASVARGGGYKFGKGNVVTHEQSATFGVMQPTGDRWGADPKQPNCCGTAYADRVCGSPWMGREFIQRINGGAGPFWEGYTHMFPDEEMQAICQRLGILWQRPDLTQKHMHWGREYRPMPSYLKAANSPAHWDRYRRLFENRKAAGFPGHEPLPVEVFA